MILAEGRLSDYRTLVFCVFIFQKCICELIISYACHGRLVATGSPEHIRFPPKTTNKEKDTGTGIEEKYKVRVE